jgi:hypothetical protein
MTNAHLYFRELRSIFSYLQASIVKKFVLDDEEENNRQTIRYNCVR